MVEAQRTFRLHNRGARKSITYCVYQCAGSKHCYRQNIKHVEKRNVRHASVHPALASSLVHQQSDRGFVPFDEAVCSALPYHPPLALTSAPSFRSNRTTASLSVLAAAACGALSSTPPRALTSAPSSSNWTHAIGPPIFTPCLTAGSILRPETSFFLTNFLPASSPPRHALKSSAMLVSTTYAVLNRSMV